MGIISGLMGHATEMDTQTAAKECQPIILEGEEIQQAYKLVRDLIIFTNFRLVIVDKQGMTGKKQEWLTIPYKSITRFSKETAGHFDLDAELRIWISGDHKPIKKEFRKDKSIHDIYKVLSYYVLSS